MNNKYAQKVLEETKKEPRFSAKSLVYIKDVDKNSPYVFSNVIGSPAFVIETDSSPVTSAAKGAKKYRVLPFGMTHTIELEERCLTSKKPNKKENK